MIPIRYNGQERLPLNDEKNASHVRRNEKDIPGTENSMGEALSFIGHVITELSRKAKWRHYYMS